MVQLRLAAAVCGALLLATPALASSIQYIFTGTAVGDLGGQAFSGALTVTASGDTGDVGQNGNTFSNNTVTTVIDIPGLGPVTVTGADYVFDNQTSQKIGYGVNGIPHCCDIIQFVDLAYATYDLKSAIGPIPFPSDLSIGDWVDVPTTGGLLTLAGFRENTFRAVVNDVPEPATLALVAGGLLGLGAVRRRRQPA